MTPTPDGDPQRWVVVWGERFERETYIGDKALAVAYAAAHHGVVVPFVPTISWPRPPDPVGNFSTN